MRHWFDVATGQIPAAPDIESSRKINRYQLRIRNIHEYAKLRLKAPDCFAALSLKCFLSLYHGGIENEFDDLRICDGKEGSSDYRATWPLPTEPPSNT
jgi:hypothetical protein